MDTSEVAALKVEFVLTCALFTVTRAAAFVDIPAVALLFAVLICVSTPAKAVLALVETTATEVIAALAVDVVLDSVVVKPAAVAVAVLATVAT